MAEPKKKKSKSRSRMRRAKYYKMRELTLVECSHCHELILPHRVCPYCGYYAREEVIVKEAEEE